VGARVRVGFGYSAAAPPPGRGVAAAPAACTARRDGSMGCGSRWPAVAAKFFQLLVSV